MLYERFFLDFLRFFAEWLEKRKTFWYTENKDHGGGGKKEKMMERAENVTGWENILLPLSIHNMDISTAEKRLTDIAGFLGITDVLSKFPTQKSRRAEY